MNIACQACGAPADHDPAAGYLPPGWKVCRIGALALQLCPRCGEAKHFIGGLSPHLKDLLVKQGYDLGEDA